MVWATDEKVTKFCTWDPYTSRDDAVNFIANVATQFLWFRAICLNDRAIGSISVCSYAGGDKCRGKSGEIGYVLGSKYWGKGIATKAVKESVGVVFDEMRELERVEALVDVENVRSQRVLQKCGFQREGVLRKYLFVKGKSRDRVMFSILSSEFGRETEIEGKILNPLEEGQTQVARKQIEVYQAVRKSKMARKERMDTGEDRMEKTTLEGETIELGEERDKTIEVTKHALVRRVIAPKPLNRRTVRTMLIKSWGYPKGIHIVDLSTNTFLFNFNEANTPRRIMEEAPWNVMGYLISLQRWVLEVTIHEVSYDYSPFWIQIHGVPLQGYSEENAIKIAKKIGEVLNVENPIVDNKIIRGFLHVRVLINIKEPLITSFWVPRGNLPKTWVALYYEKLQDYCYNCGRIGHEQKDCKEEKAMAHWDPSVPRYGPGLGVPPAKTLASVIAEMKQVQKGESSREKEKGEHVAMEKDKSRVSQKIGVSEYWKVKEKDMEMIEKLQWKVRRGEMTEQMELEQAAEIRHQNDIGKDIQSEKAAEEKLSGFRGDKARIKIAEAHFDTKAQILTRIDLREERIRAGLGPKHLDQLDLEPKHIGLKIPMIITESMSPTCAASSEQRTNEGPIKLDYPLSQEEIRRCREVPTKENTTGRRNEMFEEENGRNLALCVWEPREKPKNDEGEYYTVELPPEDDNEGEEERKEEKKENDMEAIVITEITNRLSLKRPRKEEKNEDDGVEVNEDSLEMEDDECRITTIKRQKAEEAGLIMPPQARKRKVENLKRKLCFDDVFVVEAEGRSGGLAILWKKEIQISRLYHPRNAPWCCVGYFNEILSQSEKEGVCLHSQNQIDVFRSFIDQNCLIDLPLKGCRFTWSNNREQGCVKEKIDRVLANRKWLNMFPNAVINALPAIGSDHSPLVVMLNPIFV
ncbi:putative N-acetyltransferase [Senna tora]|uniref:Putative N-acetyltransferase n=1 Tax=Senna tora TaxID=362788 RepID=A0A834SQ82_9FABA|nr:putative N-acetyltransferase [Senna tora]